MGGKHVVIACGGTGGHLFPGIAVAEELEILGCKTTLLISEKKVDATAAKKYEGLNFVRIKAVAKPATLSVKMIPFLFRMLREVILCKKLLKSLKADVVLGMGGFTSLAPVVAGKQLRLTTFVHDSNAFPGKANRLAARWCDKVLLSLKAAKPFFKGRDVVVTGTPVRSELNRLPCREKAAEHFSLNSQLKTVLVMGGSQGAKQLNSVVIETAMAMPGVQFLHITGSRDYERVLRLVGEDCKNHVVLEFCAQMNFAYALTDVVVMRSGASSLSEVAYLGIGSILIPYPYAADDHQMKNAEVFENEGAAVVVEESELDAGRIMMELTGVLDNLKKMVNMGEEAARLGVKDSASQISQILLKEI